jgi:transcriptional regulator with XRE-family HTH domain
MGSSLKTKKTSKKHLLNEKIAGLFRRKRLKLDLPIGQVAAYLGITPRTLEAYETAKTGIPLSHIYGLSNCLNVSPEVVVKLIDKVQKE